MAEYELKQGCGTHVDEDGEKYYPGDVIETDRDLLKAFPNKFIQYGVQPTKAPKNAGKRAAKAKKAATKSEAKPAADEKDVTDDFSDAADAGVSVVKIGKKYDVRDGDGSILTDRKLVTKAAASSVIDDLLEDSDGEE